MPTVPRPRLTHFGLYVRDVERMTAFYTEVLGLTVTDRGHFGPAAEEIVFLSSDPGEHHQFVLIAGRPETLDFNVAQQMSFLVGSLDELRTLHRRIVADGRQIERCVTHGNAWSVYFMDPEGNRAEVYAHTPWHVPQPHGHPIDLTLPESEIVRLTEAHCRATPGFMTAEEREVELAERMRRGA